MLRDLSIWFPLQPLLSFAMAVTLMGCYQTQLGTEVEGFDPRKLWGEIYDRSDIKVFSAAQRVGFVRAEVPGSPNPVTCSAVLTTPNTILTAYHCLPGRDFRKPIKAWFYPKYIRKNELGTRIEILLSGSITNIKSDYAFFKLSDRVLANSNKLGLRVATISDQLALIAHPGRLQKLYATEECRIHHNNMTSGTFLHTCSTVDGSSGGGVFDWNTNELIGIHLEGPDYLTGREMNLGIYVKTIVQDLEQKGLKPQDFFDGLPDQRSAAASGRDEKQRSREPNSTPNESDCSGLNCP